MPKIRELPEAERPRERLTLYGADALSNAELLAILIGSGQGNASALDLAARVLAVSEQGIAYLATASVEELQHTPGVGSATACRIAAAAALGRRIAATRGRDVIKFTSPEDIVALFMDEMRRETQEAFRILLLNIKNEMIGRETVSVGNISSSIVDPRDVFKPAIRRGAAGIVLVHNHPSGDPEPSDPDLEVTQHICDAGELLGVRVMDHIIIGDGNFVSMKKRKLIFREERF
ncbi:MAG: DNA repair protein RadC [Clostridiales Family XIII bacterium]|jgi:DNA repair protein RadC|nr:DNA repair protein RadC [Clostridiales Family XIII bacterium]